MSKTYESRDPFALIVKAVVPDIVLFNGRTNQRTNSLSASSINVITLNTLVKGTGFIVAGLAKDAGTSDYDYLANTATAKTEIAGVWQEIIDVFEDKWDQVLDGTITAGELRATYVFPHGLGWTALAQAAGTLIEQHGGAWTGHFQKGVKTYNWERTAPEWDGNAVIHDPAKGTNRVNNTGPGIRQLSKMVINAGN